jgi:hypothetical protein
VVAQTNFFRQIVRHLQQLKRQLEREGVTATIDAPKGGTRATLQVPGVNSTVTCRSNSTDANHLWYFHGREPLTPAGGTDQACEAATKILKLRAEAPTQ